MYRLCTIFGSCYRVGIHGRIELRQNMGYSRFNIIYQLQKWMDSVAGQTFLNYAYSWGASVVILGTLFKLTHMPSANFWLFLGMGTEVVVFFISAFDRPFDKVPGKDDETEETGEMQTVTVNGEVKKMRLAPVAPPDGGLLEMLNTRLAELEKLNRRLPDGTETDEIRKVLTAIHQVYQQQLLKVSSQLVSIDKMDEQFKIQTAYITELNKVYARMLDAVRVKDMKVEPQNEE